MQYSVAVLGAGTWGITLARMLANKGDDVRVWSAVGEEIELLSASGTHKNLPGVEFPHSIKYTKDISDACRGADVTVFAVPSVYIRSTARAVGANASGIIVSVAKGLEPVTLLTMSEIIEEEIGSSRPIVALSGPSHAEEVSHDMLTSIVAASRDPEAARSVQEIFSTDYMRVYTNPDILGVELCGALKNIIAIAAGICRGVGNGDNAIAALLTRGMAEISRLGIAMGCESRTFAGLAGIGDLIVTATSLNSRNNRAGTLIGKGVPVKEAVREVGMVVEGLNALEAAMALSRKYEVEMPIVAAVDSVVNGGITPMDAINSLMGRKKTREY